MKLITRDTDYAIRAICYLAKHKKRVVSVPELIQKLKVPRPFLRKLLQILSKNGVVRSRKGIGGGFVLGAPAHKIYIMRIMGIFQGEFLLNECFLKKIRCPHTGGCILKKKITRIESYVARELNSITIHSLLQ